MSKIEESRRAQYLHETERLEKTKDTIVAAKEAFKEAVAKRAAPPPTFKDIYTRSEAIRTAWDKAFRQGLLREVGPVGRPTKYDRVNAIERNQARDLVDMILEEAFSNG